MLARRSGPQAGIPDPTQGSRSATGGQHEWTLRGPRKFRFRVHRLREGERGRGRRRKKPGTSDYFKPHWEIDSRETDRLEDFFDKSQSSEATFPGGNGIKLRLFLDKKSNFEKYEMPYIQLFFTLKFVEIFCMGCIFVYIFGA